MKKMAPREANEIFAARPYMRTTQREIHDNAVARRIQFLKWHLIEGKTQAEIARRMGITPVCVGQVIRAGYRDIINGRIKLPSDFDISKAKTLVKDMLRHTCSLLWDNFHEAEQNYEALSRLTIPEQLDWIRKSKKIRWYQ